MLRKFKHENVITLLDVYCKVEDQQGSTGVFPWFETIENEPILWVYDDGSKKEQRVTILKYYLVMQYCPWNLQNILDSIHDHKLPIDKAH